VSLKCILLLCLSGISGFEANARTPLPCPDPYPVSLVAQLGLTAHTVSFGCSTGTNSEINFELGKLGLDRLVYEC
jgi:hypothetical protein